MRYSNHSTSSTMLFRPTIRQGQRMPICSSCNTRWVRRACGDLIKQRRGKGLGEEILADLAIGHLRFETIDRLSRWCHPEHAKPKVQDIAENLSLELLGFIVPRLFS
jgi:hypothetical protein